MDKYCLKQVKQNIREIPLH